MELLVFFVVMILVLTGILKFSVVLRAIGAILGAVVIFYVVAIGAFIGMIYLFVVLGQMGVWQR